MSKLVLIGCGGHCKSVLDSVLQMRKFDEIVVTDANMEVDTKVFGCRIAGSDLVLPDLRKCDFQYAFITVGSIKTYSLREHLETMAGDLGFKFPVITDFSAIVSNYALLGEGTYVGKNAVINADVKIGKHCIINTGAVIDHESVVGDFSHISVGAILCGNVCVGKGSFIGAGSTVIQGIKIGQNSVVGAGSVVNRDLPDNCTAVGVPAKIIRIGEIKINADKDLQ